MLCPDSDPPAVEVINADATTPVLLICDHASRRLPAKLGDCDLSEVDRARHIAWDIGAADVTRYMARRLNAAAVFAGYSRLVVDCNRHPHDPTLMPAVSDGTAVSFNASISETERQARLDAFYRPYHDEVAAQLTRLSARAPAPAVLSIHSCTPQLNGQFRPWQIGICWERDRRMSGPVLANLTRRGDLKVGDNEPYALESREDYSIPRHAMSRGWPHLQVEFRQDLIDTPAGAERYAEILLDALRDVLADSALYRPENQ